MVERVKSHRRAVRDETGKTTEIEYAVKAENIIDAGDLQETAQVVSSGEAVMVNVDGTLRRTTLAALLQWFQAHIQEDISFNIPYVDNETKHWMRYNPATGAYEDTGTTAEGSDGISATINGVTTLTVQATEGVKAAQNGNVLTIQSDKDVMASKEHVANEIQTAITGAIGGAY